MKIIHTADLHLDSAMKTNLSKEKAKMRKNEILHTFERMVDYAKNNDVSAILIAGDLFDTKTVTVKTRDIIKRCIEENPGIDFFYLKGNHDNEVILYDEEIPSNLKFFDEKWISYEYGDVVITGAHLSGKSNLYDSLLLDKGKINIVTLNGQEQKYVGKDKTEVVNLPLLKDKYIDYLALGHIHSYKEDKLDSRGIWVYSGCIDGRGYDECGEKGFSLITVEDGEISHEFVPFMSRLINEIRVDIKGCETTSDVDRIISEKLYECSPDSLVKVVLTGKISIECSYDLSYIEDKYKNNYFAFKIEDDEVGIEYNMEDYMYDASLKGEFIRTVMAENYTEDEKRQVIEMGLKALSGEEL